MLNLIRADFYRVFCKQSLWIYFGALSVGVFLLSFVRSGGFTDTSVVMHSSNTIGAMTVLTGGYFFAALYTDDLSSRNLANLVGYGLSKVKIALAKLITFSIFSAMGFLLITLVHLGSYAALGFGATAMQTQMIFTVALQSWLLTVAYGATAGIVAFGTQKATSAMVTYLALAFSVVSLAINLAFKQIGVDLATHLFSGTSTQIMSALMPMDTGVALSVPLIEYITLLIAAVTVAIVAFRKKELEF